MRKLAVYEGDTLAGQLVEHTTSKYTFTYSTDYVKSSMPPISLTLPKRTKPFVSEKLFPFFSNMLPEGVNRRTVCIINKIDERDSFGLLMFFAGKDMIGNVSFRRV